MDKGQGREGVSGDVVGSLVCELKFVGELPRWKCIREIMTDGRRICVKKIASVG